MSLAQIAYLNGVSERTVRRAVALRCAQDVARKKSKSNIFVSEDFFE
jgi:hypothetical protein